MVLLWTIFWKFGCVIWALSTLFYKINRVLNWHWYLLVSKWWLTNLFWELNWFALIYFTNLLHWLRFRTLSVTIPSHNAITMTWDYSSLTILMIFLFLLYLPFLISFFIVFLILLFFNLTINLTHLPILSINVLFIYLSKFILTLTFFLYLFTHMMFVLFFIIFYFFQILILIKFKLSFH